MLGHVGTWGLGLRGGLLVALSCCLPWPCHVKSLKGAARAQARQIDGHKRGRFPKNQANRPCSCVSWKHAATLNSFLWFLIIPAQWSKQLAAKVATKICGVSLASTGIPMATAATQNSAPSFSGNGMQWLHI